MTLGAPPGPLHIHNSLLICYHEFLYTQAPPTNIPVSHVVLRKVRLVYTHWIWEAWIAPGMMVYTGCEIRKDKTRAQVDNTVCGPVDYRGTRTRSPWSCRDTGWCDINLFLRWWKKWWNTSICILCLQMDGLQWIIHIILKQRENHEWKRVIISAASALWWRHHMYILSNACTGLMSTKTCVLKRSEYAKICDSVKW